VQRAGVQVAGFRLPGNPSQQRALAKAISWRIVGTIDTFVWSLLISHKPFQASSIASTELLTKVPMYYIHERVWRYIHWAPDSHARSFVKSLTWRFFSGMDTFARSWLFTGKLEYAWEITSAETVTKIVLYYLHERAWRLIPWGRMEAEQQLPPRPANP
jgi:uncharacterized membrane protein